MSKKIFNLPNMLTCYRFPAGLAMLWLVMRMDPRIYPENQYPLWIALTILIISILTFLTDFYDGKVARRYNIVTDFGKIMDPVTDSLFFTLLLLGLALSGRFAVSIWFTVIMIYREAGVQIIRRIAALKGVVLMAGWAGKLKMALQGIVMGIFGFAAFFNDAGWLKVGERNLVILAWTGSAVTALCGVLSLAAYIKQLPQMIAEQKEQAEAAKTLDN